MEIMLYKRHQRISQVLTLLEILVLNVSSLEVEAFKGILEKSLNSEYFISPMECEVKLKPWISPSEMVSEEDSV